MVSHDYLNVFVCGAVGSGIAGYTYYPSGFGTSMSNGIWLRHDYCGSIGTALLTGQEHLFMKWVIGWFTHTWGSSNEPGLASNCNMDDGVSDTQTPLAPHGVITMKQQCLTLILKITWNTVVVEKCSPMVKRQE